MSESPRDRWDRIRRTPSVPAALSYDEAVELLVDCDPEEFYESLVALARPSHGELLQALPYSPDLSFHIPGCIVVEPEPADVDTVRLYARGSFPNFDKVLMTVFDDPRHDDLWNDVYLRLVYGNSNIAMVTNHGQIVDIAVVLGGLVCAMCRKDRRYGVLEQEAHLDELAPRLNLLVSRMVATRQAFGIPGVSVLATFCRTFFSIPQTVSRRRARIDPNLVRASNIVMRKHLADQLAEGGQLLAMAASGSQDLSLTTNLAHRVRAAWRARQGEERDDGESLHLQPLQKGTMSMMIACEYVLPISVSFDPAHPCAVLGQLTAVTDEEDCHRVMEWIAASHERETGIASVYHRVEDDLLSQVRAALSRR